MNKKTRNVRKKHLRKVKRMKAKRKVMLQSAKQPA